MRGTSFAHGKYAEDIFNPVTLVPSDTQGVHLGDIAITKTEFSCVFEHRGLEGSKILMKSDLKRLKL